MTVLSRATVHFGPNSPWVKYAPGSNTCTRVYQIFWTLPFRQLREQLFQAEERFKFANKKETELQDLANDLSQQFSQARDQLSSLQKN